MIAGGGLFGLIAIALWIYCIFDCIRTGESVVQNLPKTIWLLIVIFVPTVGSIAWLLLGRPTGASFQLGSSTYRAPPPPPEPTGFAEPKITDVDDYERRREETLRRYEAEREERLRQREEELRRREEELRRREEGTEEPG